MAKEAPVAVLFCRQPRKWTCMVRWDTSDDTFERGQFVKGRLRICDSDLSPDGTRIVYQLSRYRPDFERQHITVISRPPYFTALACWTGMGGGRFVSNNEIILNGLPVHMNLINGEIPADVRVSMERTEHANLVEKWQPHDQRIQGTDPLSAELYDRIAQDLRAIVEWIDSRTPKFEFLAVPEVRRKPGAHFDLEIHIAWNKRAFQRGKAPLRRVVEKRVVCHNGKQTVLNDATWADVDQAGRIVFARGGIMYSIEVGPTGDPTERLLADFSQDRFERVLAPEWATKW